MHVACCCEIGVGASSQTAPPLPLAPAGESVVDMLFGPGALTLIIIAINQLYNGFLCKSCASKRPDGSGPARALHKMEHENLHQVCSP